MKTIEINLRRLLFKSDAYIDDLLNDYDNSIKCDRSGVSLSGFGPTYQHEKFKAVCFIFSQLQNVSYMYELLEQLENDDQFDSITLEELKDRVLLLSSIIDEKV